MKEKVPENFTVKTLRTHYTVRRNEQDFDFTKFESEQQTGTMQVIGGERRDCADMTQEDHGIETVAWMSNDDNCRKDGRDHTQVPGRILS